MVRFLAPLFSPFAFDVASNLTLDEEALGAYKVQARYRSQSGSAYAHFMYVPLAALLRLQ